MDNYDYIQLHRSEKLFYPNTLYFSIIETEIEHLLRMLSACDEQPGISSAALKNFRMPDGFNCNTFLDNSSFTFGICSDNVVSIKSPSKAYNISKKHIICSLLLILYVFNGNVVCKTILRL